jgi:calcium-dependent protein kinase
MGCNQSKACTAKQHGVQSGKSFCVTETVASTVKSNSRPTNLLANICRIHDDIESVRSYVVDHAAIIGSGRNGNIVQCTHAASKHIFASKFQKYDISPEFDHLKALDHPNILRPFAKFSQGNVVLSEFLSGGEFFSRCRKYGAIKEVTAKKYVSSILYAVKYCHSKNIVHCDIKLENLVFEDELIYSELKLIDFDTSKILRNGERLHSGLGTPLYSPPEVFQKNCKFLSVISASMKCNFVLF